MTYETENAAPAAVLVGFTIRNVRDGRVHIDDPLAELRELVESMGSRVVGEVFQNNMKRYERFLISRHLVNMAKVEVERTGAGLVCVDDTLSGSQRANIEDEIGCEVLDRTEVILQIFARRAHTADGILQVELAQLTYLLPRLRGRGGKELSALGGGIGTRGPGETKLETDRRVIAKRISKLKKEIELVGRRRGIQRRKRKKSGIPMVSLVGYTNSGKTTLLNAISGEQAYADDRLFATLDPLTRRVFVPKLNREVLFTDTVGFIDRLPTELIAAFKSTLEEVTFADLLAVLVDGSESGWPRKLEVVDRTIKEIGAGEIPRVIVFTKSDLYSEANETIGYAGTDEEFSGGGVKVSAINGEGIDKFFDSISGILGQRGDS